MKLKEPIKQPKREKIGVIDEKLRTKDVYLDSLLDIQESLDKKYVEDVVAEIEIGKKKTNDDFFIAVYIKDERKILQRVLPRKMIMSLKACPFPTFDQVVYRYYRSDDRIELLWSIPAPQVCQVMKDYPADVHPNKYGLLKFVHNFFDGTLDQLSDLQNADVFNHPEL